MAYELPITADASSILDALKATESGLDRVNVKAEATGKELNNAFKRGEEAAQKMESDIKDVPKQMDRIKDKAKEVSKEMNNVKNASSSAFDEKPVSRYQIGIGKIKNFFKEFVGGMKDGYKQVMTENNKLNTSLDQTGGKIRGLESTGKKSLGGLGTIIAGVFGGNLLTGFVSKIGEIGKSIFDTTVKMQNMEAVLTNTLGSNGAAKASMQMIMDFAAKTPFAVDELTGSFIKLVNRGFLPTEEELTKLGDLAASQGKSFDQLTEAILDAQTGEFERMKEFGIRASAAGDMVTLSFKGIEKQVKKTDEEALRNAIISFGQLEGVAGGMAAMSATLGGQVSNLQDNIGQLFVTIGDGAAGALTDFVKMLNGMVEGLNNMIKSGAVADFFQPLISAFDSLYTLGQSLISNGTEWAQQSGFLEEINGYYEAMVNAVSGLVTFVGQLIDAVVSLFTETSGGVIIMDALIEVWHNFLALATDTLNTIGDLPYLFESVKAAGIQMIENLKSNFQILANQIENIGLKIKRAFTIDDDAIANLNNQISRNDVINDQLKLQIKPVGQAAKDAYDRAKAEGNARLRAEKDERAARRKAEEDEIKNSKAKLPAGKRPSSTSSDADLKRAQAEQKKSNDQIIKFNQMLSDAVVEGMEKGYEKERQVIEANYKKQVENINKEKVLTKEAEAAKVQLLDQLYKNKEAKLKELSEKENATKLAIQLEAAKTENALREDSLQKTIEGINLDFQTQEKQIKEKYKDQTDLQSQLIDALTKSRDRKIKEAGFEKQRNDIEMAGKVNAAMAQAYGDKIVAVGERLNVTEADLAQKNKIDITKIKKEKQLAVLAVEIDTAKKLSDLAEKQYGPDSDEAKLAKAHVVNLQNEFSKAVKELKGTVDLNQLFSQVGNTDVAGSLSSLFSAKGLTNDGKSIADQMGLSEEEQNAIVGGFTAVYDSIMNAYSTMIDSQIEEKDRHIQALSDQISEVEGELQREQDAQFAGYANNVAEKQKELDELKAQRDKDQKDKEALLVKKRKLAQVEIAVSTAATVAQLILAMAQVTEGFSKIPIVGVVLGIAAAAALFAGFTAIRAKAKEGIGNVQSFGEGGWIDGPDHSQGGVKYRSDNPNAGVVELEGKEHVTNKRSAKKFPNLLNSINADKWDSLSFNDDAFKEMLNGLGISLSSEQNKTVNKNDELTSGMFNVIMASNNRSMEAYLAQISNNTKVVADDVENKETTTIDGKYKIIKKKNHTRKILINED